MARPTEGTFHPIYQQRYIDATKGDSVAALIENHSDYLIESISSIPVEKAGYSYAEGKWTVKQLLQHVIDTERILGYRALCISRGETACLPGFDEDSYAEKAPATHRSLANLKEEFVALRLSTDLLLASFTEEQLAMKGLANGYEASVNALCFIIFGHVLHHVSVLEERYL